LKDQSIRHWVRRMPFRYARYSMMNQIDRTVVSKKT
jgi:hypothetical protein